MSYCSNDGTDSDVYVVMTTQLECVGCKLIGRNFDLSTPIDVGYIARSRIEMIGHLGKHRLAGDRVPQRAIARLYREME